MPKYRGSLRHDTICRRPSCYGWRHRPAASVVPRRPRWCRDVPAGDRSLPFRLPASVKSPVPRRSTKPRSTRARGDSLEHGNRCHRGRAEHPCAKITKWSAPSSTVSPTILYIIRSAHGHETPCRLTPSYAFSDLHSLSIKNYVQLSFGWPNKTVQTYCVITSSLTRAGLHGLHSSNLSPQYYLDSRNK